jgi:hypothetical protein
MRANPRIGQTFTNLLYWPYHLHEVVTPATILVLFVTIFVLALGRLPDPTNIRDSALCVVIMALCWISLPEVGHAFFFRPITGNYVFGAALQLLLFVPLRLRYSEPRNPVLNIVSALLMFTAGLAAGMANEHTGPVAIVAYAVIVVWRARRSASATPLWSVTGWVGLSFGYFALFTAPAQTLRYRGLATENTLIDNLTLRGWEGNLEFLARLMVSLLPLLTVVTVVMLVSVITMRGIAGGREGLISRRQFLEVNFLAICAAGIVATSFFSPLARTRLFIAPMLLVVIAAVIIVDSVARSRVLFGLIVAFAIAINAIYIARVFVLYRAVGKEFRERVEFLESAEPGAVVCVPLFSYPDRTRIFIGDDFTRESRRRWAAYRFGLERIDAHPRSVPDSD